MIDFHMHPIDLQELRSQEDCERARRVFMSESSGEAFAASPKPLQEILNRLDAAMASSAVILPIECKRARGMSLLTNQEVKKICSFSDRFIGFASVDPLDPEAVDYLEEAKSLGLYGLKLDPGLQSFNVSDVTDHHFWTKIQEWNWPVVMHVGYTFSPHVSMYACTNRDVELLAERYPGINFVITHWGFPWTMEACLLAIKLPNIYIDTSALYFDNPSRFVRFLFEKHITVSIVEKSLRSKIIFGSNYPKVRIRSMRKAIEELPLSSKCQHAIFQANAERLLNNAQGG